MFLVLWSLGFVTFGCVSVWWMEVCLQRGAGIKGVRLNRQLMFGTRQAHQGKYTQNLDKIWTNRQTKSEQTDGQTDRQNLDQQTDPGIDITASTSWFKTLTARNTGASCAALKSRMASGLTSPSPLHPLGVCILRNVAAFTSQICKTVWSTCVSPGILLRRMS